MRQIQHTTLLDPATKVITSVTVCKEFLEALPPYSPSVLRALVSSPEDSEGVYVQEVTSHPPWLSKACTPVKTPRSGLQSPGQSDPLTEFHTMTKHATDQQLSGLHVQRLELRPSEALPPSPSMTTHGSPSYEPVRMDTPHRGVRYLFNICAVVPDISRVVDVPLPMEEKIPAPDLPSQPCVTSPSATGGSSFPQLTEGSFHLHVDSTLSSSVKCLTQLDPGSESISGSPTETIIDLTHSSGESITPFQLPVPPKDTRKDMQSAAMMLSTAFSSLPQSSPSTRPRSGSLESDQLLAIQKVISAACSPISAVQKPASKSVPPSPARPVTGKPTQLVPPESRATSPPPISLMPSNLSPIPDAQRRLSASPLQDAQRPFSRSEEEYSVPFPDDSDQTIQGSPEKPDPPASMSSEDLIDFTETLFMKVHPSKVERLPPQLIAMLYNINSFVAHNCSEILERLEDTQSSATDTICESQLTHSITQEANVALLEKSFNYETSS